MSSLSNSPLLKSKQLKAPLPSPALLALREKGLELSNHTNKSGSSPGIYEPLHQNQHVSPFSLASTSSTREQPLSGKSQVNISRRSSSVGSTGTTVTTILNLYTNLSDLSLQSEYEELTPYPDDPDEDAGPEIPTVHQPKAYRDTIAPLLEHQFSNFNLTVPVVGSPQSLLSLPKLLHPNANSPVTSFHLEPDTSSHTDRKVSDTSIQITPDISPPLPSTTYASAPPSFQKYSQELARRKITLEVPDVRMTGPWYDQPVSPGPCIKQVDNRGSYESATTVISIDYERQIAYDTLAPPITRKSPQIGHISVVHDEISLQPSSVVVRDVIKQQLTPPPLDLSRMRSPSNQNAKHKDHQGKREGISTLHESANDFSRNSGPLDLQKTTTEGIVEETTFSEPKNQFRRPNFAPSSDSDDSLVIHDTFRGHLKALWRHKFNKKEKSAQHMDQAGKARAEPTEALLSSSNFVDDPDSYRFPYKPSDGSESLVSRSSIRVYDRDGPITNTTGSLDENGAKTSYSRDSNRSSSQQAIPSTRFQKYGPEVWYERNKLKRRKERKAAKKAVVAEPPEQTKNDISPDCDEATGSFPMTSSHSRPASLPVTPRKMSPDNENDTEIEVKKMVRRPRTSQNYNDSIFEASGGKKKSGFASRLLMSSEEKRKLKVKESILVVGSACISGGKQIDRGSSNSVKPLVRL